MLRFDSLGHRNEYEFVLFHKKHPEVYEIFSSIADRDRARRAEHGQLNAVFADVRRHWGSQVRDQTVKLNNRHKGYYARLYNLDVKQDFFKTRRMNSYRKPDKGTNGTVLSPQSSIFFDVEYYLKKRLEVLL